METEKGSHSNVKLSLSSIKALRVEHRFLSGVETKKGSLCNVKLTLKFWTRVETEKGSHCSVSSHSDSGLDAWSTLRFRARLDVWSTLRFWARLDVWGTLRFWARVETEKGISHCNVKLLLNSTKTLRYCGEHTIILGWSGD